MAENDDTGQAIFQKILNAKNRVDVVNYTMDLARHHLELGGFVAAANYLGEFKFINVDKAEGETEGRVISKVGHA